MKNIKTFLILIILIEFFLPNKIFAQKEAIFLLSPNSGSYEQGDNFSVEVRLNSPQPITSVKSELKFDQSIIKVESIDSAGSVFPHWWEKYSNNETGKIRLQASVPSPGEKEGLITKINFQAIKKGDANIGFESSSLVLKPNDEDIFNFTASVGAHFSVISSSVGQLGSGGNNILVIALGILLALAVLLFLFVFKKRLTKASS